MRNPSMSATPPWYRHRWPWLLAIGPAVALISGGFTFWLAANTTDSMVVDDYYRQGRAINQQLARDRQAIALGLEATLSAQRGAARPGVEAGDPIPAGATIALQLTALRGTDWPAQLTLRVIHATRAELDAGYVLRHVGAGVYRAPGVLPGNGRWLVQVEDPGRSWRLVAPAVERFDTPIRMQATAQ